MRLKEIKLINYRNYEDFSYTFNKSPLFIVGPNAAGKTNLLESVRVLSLSKSFRTRSDKELIQFNKEFTRVEGVGNKNDKDQNYAVIVNKVGTTLTKSIKINNKAKRAIDLVGKLTTVLFTPEDLNHYLEFFLLFVDLFNYSGKAAEWTVGNLNSFTYNERHIEFLIFFR